MENEFTVEAPVEQAWETLLDLERITPCLPGAALEEESGDEYKGTMTIRLGPVTQKYNGTVSFEETDEESRRAVLKADGKDAHHNLHPDRRGRRHESSRRDRHAPHR